MPSSNKRQALKFCLTYAMAAAALTLVSHALLGLFSGNGASPTDWSILEILLFVLLLGILLYFLFLRFTKRWTEAAEQQGKAAEEWLASSRALRTISACNRAVVRATAEPALLNEICRALVKSGRIPHGLGGVR
jgi:hypothetical protein